ncbi:hypothetical protein H257_04845 [Aphanomyces astaci]|uniref:Myb/SANT-like domain-containing protein n=1 Tax=Aphanomyces astaci TaxID=112090 RepID=W4GTS2_APHAT|nr:hypothetical protein H257_04845 [Aphanomyces astaci]ETV83120.1 hypothetical protein H257_04845 [Aphanomyces astaci]|eukprot:XP_009827791.1 hypothetical protein H257_04845 [Aphanomyces astaci]
MTDERANWTDEKDASWMTEMIYQVVVLGKRANSGFKKEAWQAALSKLNIEHRVNYTKVQLKARNAEMKKQYAQVSQMQHFLEGKPKRWALWETKRFPQYLHCQQLYDDLPCHGRSDANIDNDVADMDFMDNISDNSEASQVELSSGKPAKRRVRASGAGLSKRVRPSLASTMTAQLKQLEDYGHQEMSVFVKALKDNVLPTTSHGMHDASPYTASEMALDRLQSDFGAILSLDDMTIAFEVMEDLKKATLFLRMSGEV